MKKDELRALNKADLTSVLSQFEEELFKVRFRHATGQLTDSSEIGKAKKNIARAKTILRELSK